MPITQVLVGLSVFLCLVVSVHTTPCSTNVAPLSPKDFVGLQLDYIIIGGGTAGLTVASRLAENSQLQVGVVEAGNFHEEDPLIDIPENLGKPLGNPDYDWNMVTVPQPQAANRSIEAPRGKLIGGSSALNFMAWTRASKPEYDSWQSFVPGSSWNWDGMLPFFKKASSVFTDQTNPFLSDAMNSQAFDAADLGFTGPIEASFNDDYVDPVAPFIRSVNAIGIRTNANPDNGNTTGIANCRVSVDRIHGIRSYASAYFCRSAGRANFHVLMNAQVTKVLLKSNSENGKFSATGIELTSEGIMYTASAVKGVIISAGAYKTPQLLELSGIGDATTLKKLGITSIIDLPSVGENLQDHLASEVQFLLEPGVLTFDAFQNNETFSKIQAQVYNTTHGGFLAATNSIVTFVPFSSFLSVTDIQSIISSFDQSVKALKPNPLQNMQYSILRKWLEDGVVPQVELILFSEGVIAPETNKSYITILSAQLHHLNRGSVHINNTNPLVQPVIDPKWLNNDYDVQVGLRGIQLSTLVGSTPPLADMIQEKTDPPSTGTVESFMRQTIGSSDHPMGTAAMALKELGGVVDDNLIVYGTDNLRVCDASVIPMGVGTHLQATVYAIAEKLASMITDH